MGDRGNIVFVQNNGQEIYFYTHWSGCELPSILKDALIRGKDRWDDEPYLTRIIFCEMIKDDVLGITGYGITTYETDNNHANLIINPTEQKIKWKNENWSFKEYINLDNPIPNF